MPAGGPIEAQSAPMGSSQNRSFRGRALWRPTLVDRYLLREFAGPFVIMVLGFSLISLSGTLFQLADLLIAKGVAASIVLRLLLYQLPWVIVQTLPVAGLFAALFSVGRLAKDSELIIVRASGLSLRRFFQPLLAFALLVSIGAYYLNDTVIPRSNHEYQNTIRQIIFKDITPAIEENVFFRGPDNNFFYVRKLDRGALTMEDVMIYQIGQTDSPYPVMITAKKAKYANGVWTLWDGVRRTLDDKGFVSQEGTFRKFEIMLGREMERFFGDQKTTDEMTRNELGQNIALFARSGIDVSPFLVDYHLKMAQPFASLLFVLLGVPLGFSPNRRRPQAVAAGISVLVTLSYYVIGPFFRSLGVNGVLPAVLAAWTPSLLFLVAAAVVWLRLERM